MNFPIKISRGHHSDLYFPNRESLWEWLEKEETAWAWLLEDNWTAVDKALAKKAIERQYSAIQELKALTSDINLSAEQIKRIFDVIKQAHTDVEFIRLCLDDHESKIILAATANPALALGMLAQALKIPVSEESADTFAGRQAWLVNLPNSLLALLPEKLEELDSNIEPVLNYPIAVKSKPHGKPQTLPIRCQRRRMGVRRTVPDPVPPGRRAAQTLTARGVQRRALCGALWLPVAHAAQ